MWNIYKSGCTSWEGSRSPSTGQILGVVSHMLTHQITHICPDTLWRVLIPQNVLESQARRSVCETRVFYASSNFLNYRCLLLTFRLQPATLCNQTVWCRQGPNCLLRGNNFKKSPKVQHEFSSQVAVLPSVCSILGIIISAPLPHLADCCSVMENKKIQACNLTFWFCSGEWGQQSTAGSHVWGQKRMIPLTMTAHRSFWWEPA